MIQAIFDRRSIRKYKSTPISREKIEQIISAGIAAPSSKNRQPWHFIVTSGRSKEETLCAMQRGLTRERSEPLLPENARYLLGAENTLSIMHQAPVVIYVINPLGLDFHNTLTAEERIFEICNAQSVGAALENMSLTSEELGLGSLWICDIFFAYRELSEYLNFEGQLLAAIAIGYADEVPSARSRKSVSEVTTWLGPPENLKDGRPEMDILRENGI